MPGKPPLPTSPEGEESTAGVPPQGGRDRAAVAGGASAASSLAGLSVGRPVTVGVLFAALLVLGAIAYVRIPVQLVPTGYELPFLYIGIPTLPSNPADLEDKIVVPVEEMLSTVRHVRRMRSRARTGEASVLLDFEDGTDMVEAYNQVRDRMERVLPELPDDAVRYFIWKYDPNDTAVYWFGVSLDEGSAEGSGKPVEHYYELLNERLVRDIERLDGVSRVEMWGARRKMVRIEIDDDLARAAGLSTYEIIQQLREDHFTLSAGTLESGGRREAVRIIARLETLDDIRALPLSPGHRLGDVARVSFDFEDGDHDLNRINGRDAVLFGVYKEAAANAVEVCNAIRSTVLARFEDDPELARFAFHDFRNQGDLILDSIDNLTETALFGGLFAIVVLIVFVRRTRLTLTIAVAIPVSMLVTLVVMYFTGFTLNVLTLMGLMLSVGMVVDNSIVVVENIQRRRFAGDDARQAAVRGAAEVTLALVVATSTTVIVFLPMILMSGNESLSFYLGKIGYPVCVSLVASLGVSLVFIPVASALGAGAGRRAASPDKPLRLVVWLEGGYRRALGWTLRRRFDAALLFVAVTASGALPMSEMQRTDELSGSLGDVTVRFDVPAAMTLDEADGLMREVEAALEPIYDDYGVSSALVRVQRRRPRVQLFLDPARDDSDNREALIAALEARLPEYPGVSHRIGWGRSRRGDSDASLELTLSGPDSVRLAELSEEVVRRVSSLPEVVSVEADLDEDASDELHLRIDREAAQRRGLAATVIGGTVDYTLRGRRLKDLRLGGREVEMRAVGDPAPRHDLAVLQGVLVPTVGLPGSGATLSQVSVASHSRGYGSIRRTDRETVLDVKINTTDEDIEGLSERIDGVLAGFEMPRGYHLGKGDRLKQLQQGEDDQAFALVLAITFVFLLMGVLFESWLMPVAIVFSIPFAFLGTAWMLYLTDTPFDVMAGVGLIILVGIVVNNAIVLIDTIKQLRGDGLPLDEAVLEGATRRLRPVLMTALTTIFGLIPMAAGDAGIVGIPYAPLGRAVIGGLLASTLLTLFVVPWLYGLLERSKGSALSWLLRALVRRRASAPSPDATAPR